MYTCSNDFLNLTAGSVSLRSLSEDLADFSATGVIEKSVFVSFMIIVFLIKTLIMREENNGDDGYIKGLIASKCKGYCPTVGIHAYILYVHTYVLCTVQTILGFHLANIRDNDPLQRKWGQLGCLHTGVTGYRQCSALPRHEGLSLRHRFVFVVMNHIYCILHWNKLNQIIKTILILYVFLQFLVVDDVFRKLGFVPTLGCPSVNAAYFYLSSSMQYLRYGLFLFGLMISNDKTSLRTVWCGTIKEPQDDSSKQGTGRSEGQKGNKQPL